jgi:hypothetical protein
MTSFIFIAITPFAAPLSVFCFGEALAFVSPSLFCFGEAHDTAVRFLLPPFGEACETAARFLLRPSFAAPSFTSSLLFAAAFLVAMAPTDFTAPLLAALVSATSSPPLKSNTVALLAFFGPFVLQLSLQLSYRQKGIKAEIIEATVPLQHQMLASVS